ncbi:MAG: 2-oxo acid dehydrogenase subunit E2, partial [Spirochaetaceae bacterium]|nr:2-oxo acid dehydrogenase subunit E2 [Spirochaetaceae bacterium]
VPGGIVVPVVHGAAEMSAVELDAEVGRLVEQARGGVTGTHQAAAGSDGPTIVTTISNLGMFGVSHFAPMLTPPQSSALGVGVIRSVPAFVDGELVERQCLDLALTVDHRIIDGAEAARFLQTMLHHLEATF